MITEEEITEMRRRAASNKHTMDQRLHKSATDVERLCDEIERLRNEVHSS